MNSTVRISVRAQFGDTLKQFQNLRTVLTTFDRQVQTVDKSLITLSDMFDKNAAKAERWAMTVDAASKRAKNASGVIVSAVPDTKGGVGALTAADSTRLAGYGAAIDSLGNKWIDAGKKAQWTGSMMTYAITVPIAGAYYVGMKANNAYMTQLAQLQLAYGGVGKATTDVALRQRMWAQDSVALEKIMLNLSNTYGIAQTDIASTAAELTRMGDRSISLAQDLTTTTQIQRTYNTTAEQSVQLVAQIRAGWGASAKDTQGLVSALVAVQEQSRGTFSDLAAGVSRASAQARTGRESIQALGAQVSVVLQSGGYPTGGGSVGNALNTVFQRLTNVVPKAAAQLRLYGIEVNSASWANQTLEQRLETIAKVWPTLTAQQQASLASNIAGGRQAKALIPILNDLASAHSQVKSIIASTADPVRNTALAHHQLAIAMATPAANFQVLKTNAVNAAMTIARDLTPTVLTLAGILVGAVKWFAGLPQGTQHFILLGLAIIALIGPVMKIGGAFITLGGVIFKTVAGAIGMLPLLLGPLGIVLLGLGAIFLAVKAAGGSFTDFLSGLLTVVGFIAGTIYGLFRFIASLFGAGTSDIDKATKSLSSAAQNAKSAQSSLGGTDWNNPASAPGAPSATQQDALNTAANQATAQAAQAAATQSAVDQVANLTAQMKAAKAAIDAQAASTLNLKKKMDDANQALTMANLQLRLLQQQKAEMTEARQLLGDPAALRSQVTSLREMGRNIAATGNSALARRYEEQADLLQKQADKAQGLDSSLATVNNQIDAQQALVDQLTKVHDQLAAAYQNEANQLATLRQQYADLAQQLSEAKKQAKELAANPPGGNAPGVGNPNLNTQYGDLNKFLADQQKSLASTFKMPDMSHLGDTITKAMQGFGKGFKLGASMPGIADAIMVPFFGALAFAAPKILRKASDAIFGPLKRLFGSKDAYTGAHRAAEDGLNETASVFERFKKRLATVMESGNDAGFIDFSKMVKNKGAVLKDLEDVGNDAEKGIKSGIVPKFLNAAKGIGGDFLKSAFGGIGKLVTVIIPDLVTAAVTTVGEFAAALTSASVLIPLAIIAAILLIAFLLVKYHKQIWEVGKKVALAIWDGLVTAWNATCDFIGHIIKWLATTTSGIAKHLTQFAKDFVGGFWNFFQKNWLLFIDLPAWILKWLLTSNSGVAKHIRKFASDAVSWLWNGIKDAWNAFVNFELWLGGIIDGWAQSAWRKVTDFGSNLVTGIWQGIQSAWHWIEDGLNGLIGGIANSVGSVLKAPINAVIEAFNAALGFIGTINMHVPGIPYTPFHGFDIGFPTFHINELANGGIASRDQLARIGEAGPEAIVPLSANNPFINIFANTVASKMAQAMNRYSKANSAPMGNVTVNSHNTTTNNYNIDVKMPPPPPGAAPSGKDIARELGHELGKRGLH